MIIKEIRLEQISASNDPGSKSCVETVLSPFDPNYNVLPYLNMPQKLMIDYALSFILGIIPESSPEMYFQSEPLLLDSKVTIVFHQFDRSRLPQPFRNCNEELTFTHEELRIDCSSWSLKYISPGRITGFMQMSSQQQLLYLEDAAGIGSLKKDLASKRLNLVELITREAGIQASLQTFVQKYKTIQGHIEILYNKMEGGGSALTKTCQNILYEHESAICELTATSDLLSNGQEAEAYLQKRAEELGPAQVDANRRFTEERTKVDTLQETLDTLDAAVSKCQTALPYNGVVVRSNIDEMYERTLKEEGDLHADLKKIQFIWISGKPSLHGIPVELAMKKPRALSLPSSQLKDNHNRIHISLSLKHKSCHYSRFYMKNISSFDETGVAVHSPFSQIAMVLKHLIEARDSDDFLHIIKSKNVRITVRERTLRLDSASDAGVGPIVGHGSATIVFNGTADVPAARIGLIGESADGSSYDQSLDPRTDVYRFSPKSSSDIVAQAQMASFADSYFIPDEVHPTATGAGDRIYHQFSWTVFKHYFVSLDAPAAAHQASGSGSGAGAEVSAPSVEGNVVEDNVIPESAFFESNRPRI
ncbi:hypothetical protein Tco_1547976 [Tanacetum coccineum]